MQEIEKTTKVKLSWYFLSRIKSSQNREERQTDVDQYDNVKGQAVMCVGLFKMALWNENAMNEIIYYNGFRLAIFDILLTFNQSLNDNLTILLRLRLCEYNE